MFTEGQLKEIEAYILENLPRILEQDQRFALAVERVVSEKYAAKSDLAQILQEIKILREEMNLRFEASERRFEALQKNMDSRFEALREDMNQRFDGHDHRIEANTRSIEANTRSIETNTRSIETNTRSIESLKDEMNQRFDRIEQKFDDLKSWVGVVVGGFQNRAGQSLENAMAGMLRVALKRPDVREEMIQVRRKLPDHKGVMGVPGKQFEFDILVQDSEVIAFEVKSGSDVEMVEYFAQKRPIVESAFPDKQVKMVFITLAPDESIAEACVQNGVILAR
jgi:hypothetical protein